MGVSRVQSSSQKSKSYYPLFAHLAQTGQILKSRNRPGNVHDSRGADAFLRELIGELQGRFGRSRKLEFRMDAAFFNEKILKRLERSVRVCNQGSILAVARPEGARRRAQAMAPSQ